MRGDEMGNNGEGRKDQERTDPVFACIMNEKGFWILMVDC